MKVFLSWSGTRSFEIAKALREWLPSVVQAADPWMSDEDISKGARWSVEIARRLQDSAVGIICLTPENLEAPWVLFEAGALSKVIEEGRVCPYLFELNAAEVANPLAQFQASQSDREGTLALVKTINCGLGSSSLSEKRLEAVFGKLWPDLELSLSSIDKLRSRRGPQLRTDRELLEEILQTVRGLDHSPRWVTKWADTAKYGRVMGIDPSDQVSREAVESLAKTLREKIQALQDRPGGEPSKE